LLQAVQSCTVQEKAWPTVRLRQHCNEVATTSLAKAGSTRQTPQSKGSRPAAVAILRAIVIPAMWTAVLIVVAALELAVNTWCTFVPLLPELCKLKHWAGWVATYSTAMALTDVWLLSLVKDTVLLGCVLAASAVGRKGRGAPNPANHAQV
ncbi:hypothetical protein HaLaN_06170, partial [Haematococcus lacustris]